MPAQPRRSTRANGANRAQQQSASTQRREAARQGMAQPPMPVVEQSVPPSPVDSYENVPPVEEAYQKEKVPLLERLQTGPSLRQIINGAMDWIYDHSLIFLAIYGIVFLIIGLAYNRYISFGAGLVLVILGYIMSMRDDTKDTFLFYIVGLAVFAIPFIIV